MKESAFYRFGRKVGGQVRKVKWAWASVTGSEAEAIRAEHGVGRAMAAVLLDETPGDTDPEVGVFLEEIGRRLAGSVRNRLYRFQVTAVAEPHPTAFALPGGFIFVARSLVELCERDRDEMAFVIAHEMSHVIRRHAINRLLRQTALSAAALAAPARGWLTAWIRRVGLEWLERAHSREQELEADALGTLLMRAAGFDPAGAIRLLERLGGLEQQPDQTGLGAYFVTHPPVRIRLASLRRRLATEEWS